MFKSVTCQLQFLSISPPQSGLILSPRVSSLQISPGARTDFLWMLFCSGPRACGEKGSQSRSPPPCSSGNVSWFSATPLDNWSPGPRDRSPLILAKGQDLIWCSKQTLGVIRAEITIPMSQVSKTKVHSDENTCPSHMAWEQSGFELSSLDSRACVLPRMSYPSQLDSADVLTVFSQPCSPPVSHQDPGGYPLQHRACGPRSDFRSHLPVALSPLGWGLTKEERTLSRKMYKPTPERCQEGRFLLLVSRDWSHLENWWRRMATPRSPARSVSPRLKAASRKPRRFGLVGNFLHVFKALLGKTLKASKGC